MEMLCEREVFKLYIRELRSLVDSKDGGFIRRILVESLELVVEVF